MKTFIRNIYTRTALCALLAAVAVSCTEEEFGTTGPVEYGRPVTVSLSYGAPDMQVQTRAMDEEAESRVNDLLVLFFDAQTDTLVKSEYYDNTRLKSASAGNGHKYGGNVHITISTGKYYIMGVANLAMSEMNHDLLAEQLRKVKSMNDFNALTVRLGNPGSISRVVPALVMGGGYRTGNDSGLDYDKSEVCEITGSGSLQGSIHLRRLDSHIKFVIQNDNPTVITQLQPVSWQVFNVPASSYLTEQAANASNVGYDNSLVSNEFDNSLTDQSSFEFYMLENKQKAQRAIPDTVANFYHERERKENGKFIYAPDSATYVEIRMRMQLKVHQDNGTTIDRSADVKYTVHLGYCQGNTELEKANDFFSLRNTKYTYTVKVKGVDKIVVEAKKEGEKQPGAEGLVVDYIGGERILLDAHYSVFNISLTPEDISTLHYRIKTPFGDYWDGGTSFDATNEDCTWIRFAETTDKETLVSYADTRDTREEAQNENKKWLMTVKELKDLAKEDETREKWFTVFVDEYVYADKAPREYVNEEARELYIYSYYESSLDGNSTYAIGKYVIAQRSIQSFYDESSQSLLGIEHADETKGYNLDWWVTPVGSNTNESKNWYDWDGWQNVAHGSKNSQNTYGIVGRQWDKYADLTKPDKKGHKTFQMKNNGHTRNICLDEESNEREYYEILHACLSRNRDENRNGKIDADELKWYLPTLFQYQQMYMGSAALATPLFDYASITLSNMEAGNSYHFATSNCLKIFAEQGASSNRPNWGDDIADAKHNRWARNLRCVRNLRGNETGTDMSETGISGLPEQPYEHDAASRTITLTRYNKVCIRTSPIYSGGYLAAHDNFDQTLNAPYKKFQYAEKTLSVPNSASNWAQMVAANDLCKDYSEEPNQSDKGKWRIPNQTEMMFIWMAGERPAGTHFITATRYRYNNQARYCAVDPNVCYVCQLGGGRTYSVRPVRDITD